MSNVRELGLISPPHTISLIYPRESPRFIFLKKRIARSNSFLLRNICIFPSKTLNPISENINLPKIYFSPRAIEFEFLLPTA
ncbi:hypothetical protein BGLA2_2290003 [Burkholderia gladioli]|nr:hypothetical protein BGLA2_2290003 [Burkholderia gladioli]